jgi:hypothetical protein
MSWASSVPPDVLPRFGPFLNSMNALIVLIFYQ